MVRLLLIFFFTAASVNSFSQLIVNVENSRIQSDTTGWKGDIGTAFSFTKSVQQILNISASAHLQYKTKKDLYLILGNYNLLSTDNQQILNNMFYHLRYNRKLGKVLRWEAFTQWQQNSINNIDLRALYGTGPRFKIHEGKTFRIYAASLAMYEHEVDNNPKVTYNNVRSDNYVTFTYKPNNIFSATSTTFYQPLFNRIADYRILNQIVFNVRASKHFSISTNWDYSYDSRPAFGSPKVNYTVTNGFDYTF